MAVSNRRFAVAAVVLPLLFLMTSGMARASTLIVTSNADSGLGSLRAEVAAANPGDTINFAVAGPIVLASTIDIFKDLTITGPNNGIEISGNDAVHVLSLFVSTLTLNNLTIAHGKISWGCRNSQFRGHPVNQ